LASARYGSAGAGTQSAGIVIAGYSGPLGGALTATEEWTGPSTSLQTKTITTS